MEPAAIHLGSHRGTWHVQSEGCQNWPLNYNSGMDGSMVTKFGVCLETKQRCILHWSWVGYICTCIRAHPEDTAAREHVRIPFPYLGKCWTDCTEICCVARGPVARRLTRYGRFCTNAGVTVTNLSTSIRTSIRSSPKRRLIRNI